MIQTNACLNREDQHLIAETLKAHEGQMQQLAFINAGLQNKQQLH